MARLENPTGGIVQVGAELAKTLKAQGWKVPSKHNPAKPEDTPADTGVEAAGDAPADAGDSPGDNAKTE